MVLLVTWPGEHVLAEQAPPPGYAPMPIEDGFIGHAGPIFARSDQNGIVLGFRVAERHTNLMGACHGGWLASMMDMVLSFGARHPEPDLAGRYLLTVSMSIDYLAGARRGDWVEGRMDCLRRTGRLLFTQALLRVDGTPVLRGSGVFRIGPAGFVFPGDMPEETQT